MHRFSRISIHDQVASSRKLCDRVDTWRALCTYTKRVSPASVHDSPSYFLVLEQISYASPLHPSCPQPDNVRQNVLLERSSSTSSSLLRLSIAIFFFKATRFAQFAKPEAIGREERKKPWTEQNGADTHLNGCILIRATSSIDEISRVPRSPRRYEPCARIVAEPILPVWNGHGVGSVTGQGGTSLTLLTLPSSYLQVLLCHTRLNTRASRNAGC